MMEPFCVIYKRTLSSQHPLHEILQYHCRDVTVPNTIGTPALINEGAYMDKLFAMGNEGTERLLTDAYPLSTWDVTDFRSQLKVSFLFRLHSTTAIVKKAVGHEHELFLCLCLRFIYCFHITL